MQPGLRELLAQMIGVQRSAILIVANALQPRHHSLHPPAHRNHGPGRIRQTSCECYRLVRTQHDRLLKALVLTIQQLG